MSQVKVAVIGGGGARTPLLIHGLAQAQQALDLREIALYDIDGSAAQLMAEIGREVVRAAGASVQVNAAAEIERAIEGSRFVLSSIRVGGISARARDERIALQLGMTGQETTGAGGMAMGLRTIPVALEHARLMERLAPEAWLISFTNPAGMITQAVMTHTGVNAIGICDTPSELFHRTAWAFGLPYEDMEFRYAGLNHLGWVQRVLLKGEDITGQILSDHERVRRIYPAPLFDAEFLEILGMLPSEYLFFYYGKSRAVSNQSQAGATRGEEILQLNARLFEDMRAAVAAGKPAEAVSRYKRYLNQRNASYLQLEAEAGSALQEGTYDWDPFEGITGYHRIAIDLMTALSSDVPRTMVVNVRNFGAIEDLSPSEIVEIPCAISKKAIEPMKHGSLAESVRGLTLAVKAYEHYTIRAAVERSGKLAKLALTVNPLVGEWAPARTVVDALIQSDPKHLGYLSC